MSSSFPLQPLLDLSQLRLDDATRRLGELMAGEKQAGERLALLNQYRAEYHARFLAAAREGIGRDQWRNYQAFLDKLRRRKLPVSKRAQNLTVDILPVTKVGDCIIRAKTGLTGVTDKSMTDGKGVAVGWLAGWAEKGDAQTVFALNLDVREPKHSAARMKIAQLCLADIGAI